MSIAESVKILPAGLDACATISEPGTGRNGGSGLRRTPVVRVALGGLSLSVPVALIEDSSAFSGWLSQKAAFIPKSEIPDVAAACKALLV